MNPFNADLATSEVEFKKAEAGIRSPKVTLLTPPTTLYRFCSAVDPKTNARIPSSWWERGSWWLSEVDYHRVVAFSKRSAVNLGAAARTAAAVQPSFSNMDVLLSAHVIHDVYVYTGRGLPQYRDMLPNGWFLTQKGWPEVEQIYIPRMRVDAEGGDQGFRALFIASRQENVPTGTFAVSQGQR